MATFTMPPQSPLSFNHTPETLIPLTQDLIASTKALQDRIVASVTPETATFANTVLPLVLHENITLNQARHFKFYTSTHVNPLTRDASRASTALITAFDTATLLHSDLGDLISAVVARAELLKREDQVVLTKLYSAFQRNRLGNNERYVQIRIKLQELLQASVKEINAPAGIFLSLQELEGLPTSSLESLEKGEGEDEGKLWLPFKKPHFETALQWVKSGEVRKRIFIGNDNRCPENAKRFKEVLLLRQEAAQMLGYENHVEYKMEEKAVGSEKEVQNFLEEYKRGITPIARKQVEELMELKRKTLGEAMRPDEDSFFLWDNMFYSNLLKQKITNFDEKAFEEYFELENSLKGMMDIFSHLFGLSFEKVLPEHYKSFGDGHITVWHESVTLFTVWNDQDQGGEFLGYLYLDLFPRPNKYNHAGHYGLQQGYTRVDGSRHCPSGALVMNFQAPTPMIPCLLKPEQARSLFHELGHAIHNIATRTIYAVNHTFLARDFVEIPSILLENWLWTPSVLRTVGKHYSYLSPLWKAQDGVTLEEEIPETLVQQLVATRRITEAVSSLRQLFLSIFDLEVHSSSREELENMDLARKWNQMNTEITGLMGAEGWNWGNGYARLGMMVRSYDAGVYVYSLSKAFAQDLFTMFEKDPMNRVVGLRYRQTVLEPGSSKDGMVLMEEFLGRVPNMEVRSRELGLM